jgi:hypothetical protein
MFLSLSFLLFHRRKQNVVWKMFIADPGIFNEEICESALSQLARAITSKPSLRVLDAANKTYKRLGLFSATCSGLCQETRLNEAEISLVPSDCIALDSPEVRHTLTFLERTMFSIGTNTFLEYDPSHSFVYAKDAVWRALSIQPRFRAIDIGSVLTTNLLKFKKQQLVVFIASDPEVARYWPRSRARAPAPAQADIQADVQDEEKNGDVSEVEDQNEPPTETDDDADDESDDDDDDAPLSRPARPPRRNLRIASNTNRDSGRSFSSHTSSVSSKRSEPSQPCSSESQGLERPKRACRGRMEGSFAYAMWASTTDED